MLLTIEINQKLMPIDRGERYEDPLDQALQAKGLGSVTGGGTQFAENREIDHIVVDATITGDAAEAVGLIMFVLEERGAPKGSRILVPDLAEPVPFGALEGLALYLNGTDLADEVYAASDTNALMDRLDAALGDKGRVTHAWDGPRETAIYMHGPSFEAMNAAIAEFVATTPDCEMCRIVQTA